MSADVTIITVLISTLLGSSGLTELLIKLYQDIIAKKKLEENNENVRTENIEVAETTSIYLTGEREVEIATDAAIDALNATYSSMVEIRNERMRQAKSSFNVAVILMIIGVFIIFIGILLLLFQEYKQSGILTVVVGVVGEILSTVVFVLNRETNNRLDKIHCDLSAIEAAKVGLSIARQIEDQEKRDDAISDLSKNISKK